MSINPGVEDGRQIASATRTVALLNSQADRLRKELADLRKELLAVKRELDLVNGASLQAEQVNATKILNLESQLRNANEQLMIATANAENAVSDLAILAACSQHDALTGTPNRTLMLDRITSAISLAHRRGARLAVLFLDIDGFKQINDSLGHVVGDEVLLQVTRNLESAVRDSDTVSRYGGDEFLVLLTDIVKAVDAGHIARKILETFSEPVCINGHEIKLSISIGISIYPEDANSAGALVKLADDAMYVSKRRRHGSFEFHQYNDQ